MGVCCSIKIVVSTFVYISWMEHKYGLYRVVCGLCVMVITADWGGRSS